MHLPTLCTAKALARAVSERGGGLLHVEAVALSRCQQSGSAVKAGGEVQRGQQSGGAFITAGGEGQQGGGCEQQRDSATLEVACNLLAPDVSSPEAVQRFLEQWVGGAAIPGGIADGSSDDGKGKGDLEGVRVLPGYVTGKTREQLVELVVAADAGPSVA